jgi:hypothetical protein
MSGTGVGSAGPAADVIIVGAGLAGLVAACEVVDLDMRVLRSRPKVGVKATGRFALRRQHTGRGTRAAVTPPRSWPLMVSWVTRGGSRSGCFGGPRPTLQGREMFSRKGFGRTPSVH